MSSGEVKPNINISVSNMGAALEKIDSSKNLDPTPHSIPTSNFTNPNTNSEALKTFYNNLISNTPTNNTRASANANIRSAFDVIFL